MRQPKGYIVSIGGAEDKGSAAHRSDEQKKFDFFHIGILYKIVDLLPKDGRQIIEIVTTASGEPEETFEEYKAGVKKLGCATVGHLNIRSRAEAADPGILKRLGDCSCVLFSGSDQLRLTSVFRGTEFLTILLDRYNSEPFIIAATSAGAMVMSNPLIYDGAAERATLKGEVKIVSGFGLIQNVIIDTHVDRRGSFNRTAQAVAAQHGAIGIGLGEDTGVIVKKGTNLEVIGSGTIIVIDGKDMTCTNIADVSEGSPVTVQNLAVQIMAAGEVFNISTRTFE